MTVTIVQWICHCVCCVPKELGFDKSLTVKIWHHDQWSNGHALKGCKMSASEMLKNFKKVILALLKTK